MADTKKTDVGVAGSPSGANNDFVLKHRVVGAAFLLFFGALVLPWLLGPPSEASKTPAALIVDDGDGDISAVDIENEILADLEDNSDIVTEQVYISKITPLDAARVEEEKRRAEAEKASKSSAAVLAMAEVGDSGADKKSKAEKSTPEKTGANEEKQAEVSKKSSPKATKSAAKPQPVVKSSADKSTNGAKKTADTNDNKPVAKPKDNARDKELAAALAAESSEQNVDVGWVVQVGVFTDKKGAEKVVKDLKTKGFKPSTSVVDTNRGKGTGTRVWLGPFAQRVEAAKTKTRLTDRTGEPGFIRAFP